MQWEKQKIFSVIQMIFCIFVRVPVEHSPVVQRGGQTPAPKESKESKSDFRSLNAGRFQMS